MSLDTIGLSVVRQVGIRASAGSGKTYSLTSEYLRTFFGGASAESILATTFTRAAAGEILGRVLKRMADACQSDTALTQLATDLGKDVLTRDDVRFNLLRFCRSMDRVNISTIDSFFGTIASGYRYETGLTPGSAITNEKDGAVKQLRIEALVVALERSGSDAFLTLLNELKADKAPRRVLEYLDDEIAKLLGVYEVTSESAWTLPRSAAQLTDSELFQAIEALQNVANLSGSQKHAEATSTSIDHARKKDWQKFFLTGIPNKILQGETVFKSAPIPDEVIQAFLPIVDHAKAVFADALITKTEATYRLIAVFAQEYNRLRKEHRIAFFSDTPRALSKLLPHVPFGQITHRLDGEIDHLLLDEFQDTAPDQWLILFPFAQKIASTLSRPATFFCVGDVKQSIYGWRGAKADIFLNLKNQFPALEWQDLVVSYRSSPVVLNTVNRIFDGLADCGEFVRKDKDYRAVVEQWCSVYQPHQAHNADMPGQALLMQSPDFSVLDETDSDDSDANGGESSSHVKYTAAYIADLYSQHPGKSIGVLTRSNGTANSLLFELKLLGIPASAQAGASPRSDPAAALVLAALELAENPSNLGSAFRVLNSPLADSIGVRSLERRHLATVSLALREQLVSAGYGDLIADWTVLLAPHCDSRGAMHLAHLIELAEDFDTKPGVRPRDFLQKADDSVCSTSAPAPVQVMTVHKSKGMEFDIVVLPDLNTRLMAVLPPVLKSVDPESHEITRVVRYPNETLRSMHPELKRLYDEYAANEVHEALSVLYVATTRARRELIMMLAPVKRKSFSLGAILRAQLGNSEPTLNADGSLTYFASGDSQWGSAMSATPEPYSIHVEPVQPLITVPTRPQAKHALAPSMRGGDSLLDRELDLDRLLGNSGNAQRSLGTKIHAALQTIEWIDSTDMNAILSRFGDDSELSSALATILNLPGNQRAFARPLLSDGETVDLWRERKFITVVNDAIVNGTFDRVSVVIENGRPIRAEIMDFKTTELNQRTAEYELEMHRAQLTAYQEAVCSLLKLPIEAVTASVLFVMDGQLAALTRG